MATTKRTRTSGRKGKRAGARAMKARTKARRTTSARSARRARPARARARASAPRTRKPVKRVRPMTLPNELRYRPIEEPTERSDLMDVGRRESQRPDRDVERETPPRTTLGMEEP